MFIREIKSSFRFRDIEPVPLVKDQEVRILVQTLNVLAVMEKE